MVSLRPPRGRQSTSTGTQPPWIPGATDSLRSARSPMRSERRTAPGDRQRRPWRSSRSLPVLHIASRGVWIRRFRVVADRHDRGPSISSDLTSVGALDRARHRFPVLEQSLWDTTSVLPLWRLDLDPTRGPGSRRGATYPALPKQHGTHNHDRRKAAIEQPRFALRIPYEEYAIRGQSENNVRDED